MKVFFQWCASSVIASMVFALLVCGSMMGFSVVDMHDSGSQLGCADHACAPMQQDCFLSCLAGTDELEVRMVLSVVVLFVVMVATMFVPAPNFSLEFVRISAPPWRQHRLFAFRE